MIDPITFAAGIIGLAVGGIAGRLTSGASKARAAGLFLADKCQAYIDEIYDLQIVGIRQARRITNLEAEKHAWEAEKRYPEPLRKYNEKRHLEAETARHERMDKADTRPARIRETV